MRGVGTASLTSRSRLEKLDDATVRCGSWRSVASMMVRALPPRQDSNNRNDDYKNRPRHTPKDRSPTLSPGNHVWIRIGGYLNRCAPHPPKVAGSFPTNTPRWQGPSKDNCKGPCHLGGRCRT